MATQYDVRMEIAGSMAMFARPDTGATPTSYPVPTWSACKGMFESVARFADGAAWIRPVRVEVCKPASQLGGEVRYQHYTTNYGGPLRKSNQRASGTSFQFFATVLANVCYRLYGVIESSSLAKDKAFNPRHYLQDLFNRRIKQGRCHRTPCLGWSEFTASYWGPVRDGHDGGPAVSEVDKRLNLTIPSMLHSVFDKPTSGDYEPKFSQDVSVSEGVLCFPNGEMSHVE